MSDLEPGSWVTVYGQVVEAGDHSTRTHPEDVLVEFFSHSDQYQAHVRRDRVRPVEPPEGIAERCPHIADSLTGGEALVRCIKHLKHSGQHSDRSGRKVWLDNATVGYFEER